MPKHNPNPDDDDLRRYVRQIGKKGIWYYYRRVPTEVLAAFGKSHVKVSLGTTDAAAALKKANKIDAETVLEWKRLSYERLRPKTREELYEEASRPFKEAGLSYIPLEEALKEDDETLERRTFLILKILRKYWDSQA